MKYCGTCKISKPFEQFYKNRTKKDGLQTFCKVCDRGSYGKTFNCTKCGTEFRIAHRNVRTRVTRLCQGCVREYTISRVIEANKLRTKPEIFSTKGYQYLRDNKEKHGYILSHRKVMARSIGRPLRDSEIVHHIDGNRLNNDLSNLWLTDHSAHKRAHRTLEILALQLLERGAIKFNRETGEYEFV